MYAHSFIKNENVREFTDTKVCLNRRCLLSVNYTYIDACVCTCIITGNALVWHMYACMYVCVLGYMAVYILLMKVGSVEFKRKSLGLTNCKM